LEKRGSKGISEKRREDPANNPESLFDGAVAKCQILQPALMPSYFLKNGWTT
jgi:hypothetical protein